MCSKGIAFVLVGFGLGTVRAPIRITRARIDPIDTLWLLAILTGVYHLVANEPLKTKSNKVKSESPPGLDDEAQILDGVIRRYCVLRHSAPLLCHLTIRPRALAFPANCWDSPPQASATREGVNGFRACLLNVADAFVVCLNRNPHQPSLDNARRIMARGMGQDGFSRIPVQR